MRSGSDVRASLSVGLFTYSTAPRGSVVHAAALAEALTRRGCDVVLYALSKGGECFYRQVDCELELVPAVRVQGGGQILVRTRIDELASFLNERRVAHDVFHAQDCLTANGLLESSGVTSGRVFRTVHHIEQFECPYLTACQERSILAADALCAVSRCTRDLVSTRYARDVSIVGNGVNGDPLAQVTVEDVLGVRERFVAGRSGPLFLSVGGVEPRKNSLCTLEAFAIVKQHYPNAVWVIAGGATALDHGAYANAFDERLAHYTFRNDVVRCGVVAEPELRALLGAADVLFNASALEGFGLTVLEALATGLPAVVSHGEPFDEFLIPGSAWRVDPSSPKSIADGAMQALATPTQTQLVGRRVALAHTWDEVAERTLEAYYRHMYRRVSHASSCGGALHA